MLSTQQNPNVHSADLHRAPEYLVGVALAPKDIVMVNTASSWHQGTSSLSRRCRQVGRQLCKRDPDCCCLGYEIWCWGYCRRRPGENNI